jgi:hypothetical protein
MQSLFIPSKVPNALIGVSSGLTDLADRSILIVGAPRSGTTWLAKIFDSHPDVLYRHEPDEVVAPRGTIRASMAHWVQQCDPRTAAKRPFFPKSWQTRPAWMVRTGLAYAAAAASRFGVSNVRVPDLGVIARARPVIKSVRLREQLGTFARECPDGRALLILRHPYGQVASMMGGAYSGHFELRSGTSMPIDEDRALAFAMRLGMSEADFARQPDAAKYAWAWREFNETACDSIVNLPNARVVIYKDLATNPLREAADILAFAGLSWHARTEAFLVRSTTNDQSTKYYGVFRNSVEAADRWRVLLKPEDQEAIDKVVLASPLMRFWPDTYQQDQAPAETDNVRRVPVAA